MRKLISDLITVRGQVCPSVEVLGIHISMTSDSVFKGEDYHSKFGSREYLESLYNIKNSQDSALLLFMLDSLHEFCKDVPSGVRVVDVGCGPSIHGVVSLSSKSSDITCAEYTENNRDQITKWLTAKDKDTFDWSSLLKHVTVLEGKSETEWRSTEERVRSAIKQVVPCDVTKESIFKQPITDGHYDVVITSLCLEAACATLEIFQSAVKKIADILKPGGHLIMITVLDQSFYHCGMDTTSNKFFCLPVSEEMLLKTLKEAGFNVEKQFYHRNYIEMEDSDYSGIMSLMAKKAVV